MSRPTNSGPQATSVLTANSRADEVEGTFASLKKKAARIRKRKMMCLDRTVSLL
jgi:hypothetical protein